MKFIVMLLTLCAGTLVHAQQLPVSASSPDGKFTFEYDDHGKLESILFENEQYRTITREFVPNPRALNSLVYWDPALTPNIEESYQLFDSSWVLMDQRIIRTTPDSTTQTILRRANPTDELAQIERRVWYTDPVTGIDLGSFVDGEGYLYRYRIHKNGKGLIDTIYFEEPQGSSFSIEAKYCYEYDDSDSLRTIYQLAHAGSEELVPTVRWKDITWTSSYFPSSPYHNQLPSAGANWASYKTDHYYNGNLIAGDSIARTFNDRGQVLTWGGNEGGMKRYSEYYYYPDGGFRSMFTVRMISNDWDTTHRLTYDLLKSNEKVTETIFTEMAWGQFNVSRFTYNYATSDVTATASSMVRPYPNPTSDFITVDCPESITLTIHDIKGNIVQQANLSPGMNTVDVHKLPAGLYILRWREKDILYSHQVMKH